ncbi:hypothetical protein D5086_022735 [Populus alba]|uniref:Uncharacterized protein n=1 Tax=Populus alba TaxID=43335 RepID=A0ACC4B7T8_POPAL
MVGFYRNSCRRAESIVRGAVRDALRQDRGVAAGLTGGFDYDVQAGRRDGIVSLASETYSNLPPPTFNVDQLTRRFSEKGFTQEEMVTLSGAHTIGNSNCRSFTYRLYNFSGTNSQDPSLDSKYAASLRKSCPQDSTDPNLEVPMDTRTPTIIDVNYYKDILANRGLFSSDQILLTNPATASELLLEPEAFCSSKLTAFTLVRRQVEAEALIFVSLMVPPPAEAQCRDWMSIIDAMRRIGSRLKIRSTF